jgi:hypothetical protein
MCLFFAMLLLGPRAALILAYFAWPARWELVYEAWLWPVLGFLFLPWTTLMYLFVAPGGLNAFDYFWLALAVLLDLGSLFGGARSRRSPAQMA